MLSKMQDKDVEAEAHHDQRQTQQPGILNDPTTSTEGSDVEKETGAGNENSKKESWWKSAVFWSPRWCRWDERNPPKFGLPLNILFACAGTFTVRVGASSMPVGRY